MKIALAQTNIIWENKEKNFDNAEKIILEAINNSVKLILFPEMSFTGFTMNIDYSAENDEYTVNHIKDLAKENNVSIGFGWVKKINHKAENHYTIIDNGGKIISDYVKIHPFSYSNEDTYFTGGCDISLFNIADIPFSNFICYDLRFPEIFQIASQEAHFIIVPANWPKRRREHWKTLLRARAIENQVYILAINCCGENIGGLEYSGDSCIINPNGDILEHSDKPGIVFGDIVDDVNIYRDTFPIKEDRKTDLYKKFM